MCSLKITFRKSCAIALGVFVLQAASLSVYARMEQQDAVVKKIELPSAKASGEAKVLASLRMPSPQRAIKKINMVTNRTPMGMQYNMLLGMMLAPLGYPDFANVDEAQDMGVFFMGQSYENAPMQFSAVTLLKLKNVKDPSIKKAFKDNLTQMGMEFREQDGWMLISETSDNLNMVKNMKPLIRELGAKKNYDFELQGYFTNMADFKPMIQEMANDLLGSARQQGKLKRNALDNINGIKAVVHQGVEELMNLETGTVGLSVDGATLISGLMMKADSSTALGKLWSAPTKGRVDAGRFYSKDIVMGYVGDANPQAYKVYAQNFFDLMKVSKDAPLPKSWQALEKPLIEYFDNLNGSYAGALEMGENGWVSSQIVKGDFAYSNIGLLFDFAYQRMVPGMVQMAAPEGGISYQYKRNKDAFKVGEVSVSECMIAMGDSQGSKLKRSLMASSPFIESFREKVYFSTPKGFYVNSMDEAHVKVLTERVQSGDFVDNNLTTVFKPKSGVSCQFFMDIPKVIIMSIEKSMAEEGQQLPPAFMAQQKKILSSLKSLDTEPMFGELHVGDSTLKMDMRFSIDDLSEMMDLMMAVPPSMDDDPMMMDPVMGGGF